MMPRSWAASSAVAICLASRRLSDSGTGPDFRRSSSVGPSTSSRTRTRLASRFFETVDARDMRMVQRREDLRLTLEPRQTISVGCEHLRQCLDGDVTQQPRVARTKHLAHAAAPDRRDDFVRPNACANLKCHASPTEPDERHRFPLRAIRRSRKPDLDSTWRCCRPGASQPDAMFTTEGETMACIMAAEDAAERTDVCLQKQAGRIRRSVRAPRPP
jgi:hypothetical protein